MKKLYPSVVAVLSAPRVRLRSLVSLGVLSLVAAAFGVPASAQTNFVYESSSGYIDLTFGGCPTIQNCVAVEDNRFIQMGATSSMVMVLPTGQVTPDGTAAPEIRVVTLDTIDPAFAEVLVSSDGVTWTSVGVFADTANIDIDIDGIGAISFVMIDQNGNDPGSSILRGFDVDAVVALATPQPPSACPLQIGSIGSSRSSFAAATSTALEQFRAVLEANFTLSFVDFDTLLDPGLSNADLLVIQAWEYAPQPGELNALLAFIQGGGTLLINPNSGAGAVNSDLWLAPLGLDAFDLAGFSNFPTASTFAVATSTDPQVTPIVDGPYGLVSSFSNRYLGHVRGLGGTLQDAGLVRLAGQNPDDAVLGLIPRGVHGTGQVLLVTNFHVFIDPEDIGGGFMDTQQSQALLLNLVASATVGNTGCDQPPVADAGLDFSVDEVQPGTLNGILSSDPDGDPLTYAWSQLAGTTVGLSDPAAQQPTFNAPLVTSNTTLTFQLIVTANGVSSDPDTVNVTIVNVNNPPVADAGDDQTVAEGAAIAEGCPVTLHGEGSFDEDMDTLSYAWVQTGGSPTVTLTGADTANPTFTAPFVAAGGAPGIVATLVFELTVDDGSFANVTDSVTVDITNVNNDPTANAGTDQTKDENAFVMLDGSASSDPDSDMLSYAWNQTGGTGVALSDYTAASPSFTAPFVMFGGGDLTFELTVNDVFGGTAMDTVVVHVQNANDPPDASLAQPTIACLWPPNHKLVSVGIIGVSDPEDNATITIDAVFQDEPTSGTGSGDTPIDAIINADGTVLLRAERSGNGDGRVYHILFTASDAEGSDSGVVTVCVPHSKKKVASDGGQLYDSTN